MVKIIQTIFEDSCFQLEYNDSMGLIAIRVNDFEKDEEKSEPNNVVFREGQALEVFPEVEEVKELIKALQYIISDIEE